MIPAGIIEGFYGKVWSEQARLDFAAFAQQLGLDFYIFAPKACRFLRKDWQEPWSQVALQELANLRRHFATAGVEFGVGFSPFGATEALSASQAEQKNLQVAIERAIGHLNSLQLDYLCILFDDMPVHLSDLALRQSELVSHITSLSNAQKIIMCPSFYSFDPRLEDVFGAMPQGYLQDLGRSINKNIDIFWTGDNVCSKDYLTPNLQKINDIFQRKVFLWDNYPVNDGKLTSPFVHLSPSPAWQLELSDHVGGIAANPMNQAYLSQIALTAFAYCFKKHQNVSFESCLNLLDLPSELQHRLSDNRVFFEQFGLEALPENTAFYLAEFEEMDHPMVKELCGWLQGQYKFDSECLTD